MGHGINKAIIIGHLGSDPVIRYTTAKKPITSISVATTDVWKDKNTGEKQQRTEWHKIVFFNKLAEIAGEYLRKGSQVYVEGKLKTKKWTDKNNIERYSTEINAFVLQLLDSKSMQKTESFNKANGKSDNHKEFADEDIPF